MANVNGTTGNDFIHVSGDGLAPPGGYTDNPGATNSSDTIFSGGGGDDIIYAGGGSDDIHFGDDLSGADQIFGGEGTDRLFVDDGVSVTFGANSLDNIEYLLISFQPPPVGFAIDYAFTFHENNVAAGRAFTFDATDASVDSFVYADFSAETDSLSLTVLGSSGSDTIIGRSDNALDVVNFANGGADTFTGAGTVTFDDAFGASDRVNGQDRSIVVLNGASYAGGLSLTGLMLNDVGTLRLSGNFDYSLTFADDNIVDAGKRLILETYTVVGARSITIDASAETDGRITFAGGGANENITTGAGNDDINLGAGAASMYGVDVIHAGAGNDTIQTGTFGGGDEVHGGDGEDLLILGPSLNDGSTSASVTLSGTNFTGFELIQVGIFNGQIFSYELIMQDDGAAGGGMIIDASRPAAPLFFSGQDVDGAYNVVAGIGADHLVGGGASDFFSSGAGSDELDGNGGADTLNGGADGDVMKGGQGDDLYYVNHASDAITELEAQGFDTVSSSITYTLTDHVERLIISGTAGRAGTGNALANTIIGNSAANKLRGLDGNDTLNGGGGNDTLEGGAGADSMIGSAADNTYNVDNAGDIIVDGGGVDTVVSSITYVLSAVMENLTISGAAARNGVGNSGDNMINGNGAANRLTGNAGADTLMGGEGADTLNGGAGADRMEGGFGDDDYEVADAGDLVIEASAGGGVDTVRASLTHTLGANVENLIITGGAARNGVGNALDNVMTGNGAANVLSGATGADQLSGGDGADRLIGGEGQDTLTGGAGADAFVFNAPRVSANTDVVTDFNVADDIIHLDNAIFTQLGAAGALNAGMFRIGSSPADANDFLFYNSATGALYYDSNANAAGGAFRIATLAPGLALTAADFLVI